jgi:hypothetical protein
MSEEEPRDENGMTSLDRAKARLEGKYGMDYELAVYLVKGAEVRNKRVI